MNVIRRIITYFKAKPTVLITILIGLTVTEVHLNLAKYKRNDVLKWDAICYYSYLPAVFIEKDITLSFINNENDANYNWIKYGYIKTKNGERVIKTSMGVAILVAPFFLIAHSLALLGMDTADGFSSIYQFFLEFSGLFYLIVGFVFLRKLLLNFYNEKIVAIAFVLLYFGTNLLYHSAIDGVNSHVFTFGIFSLLLYYTYSFYQHETLTKSLVIGLLLGMTFIVRPINFLFVVPVFFFDVSSIKDLKERLEFIVIKQYKYLFIVMIGFAIVLAPQVAYYKIVTNSYFVFSYGEKERFYFNNPHIFEVLFSFRKGWFLYTPLMFVVVFWFIFKNKLQNKYFNISIIVLLSVYVYTVSSWWCWWYGGGFSQRAMIDLYPILILPLCSFVYYLVNTQRKRIQKLVAVFLGCLLILNCFQSLQAKYNIIDWDGMTFRSYIHVFGTVNSKNIREDLLEKPDYEKAVMGIEE